MLKNYYHRKGLEAGCDEAGRGCLAGPVYAAAVILPKGFKSSELNDSKKLSEKKRDKLRLVIEKEAISYSVQKVGPKEIDKINILNASFKAMHLAIKNLDTKPDRLLIDGNRFTEYPGIDHFCIIKGDAKYLSIAAASILAKTYRDEYMLKLAKKHPSYDWNKNKGYPTLFHRNAIHEHGFTIYHRSTFKVKKDANQLKVF